MAILRWGRRWDPMAELKKMRNDMERVFRGASEARPGTSSTAYSEGAFPPMNVYETVDDHVVTAEVPGVKVEDIEISVRGDTLTVKGKREPETDHSKVNCHRLERESGSFARTLTLPGNTDPDAVEATYVNGVLQVKLPKAEDSRPRVISVKSCKEVSTDG